MNVTVIRAGFLTTVQDLGRTGYRQSGVAAGGALDQHAHKVANLLVGNEPECAGLEATLGQLRLRFVDDRLVAWCGGDFSARGGALDLPPGRAAFIRKDEELQLTASAAGGRAWLAISGGIDLPLILGSRSTDLLSKFGGFRGRALRDGDILSLARHSDRVALSAKRLAAARIADWSAPREWTSTAPSHPFVRLVPGADRPRFQESAWSALVQETFKVMPDSDRMGVRLKGPALLRVKQEELLSEAVAPGTIQVPPSGDPILLLGDCQTVGGYPKIAHVITVDLAAAAQLGPGDTVRFAEVSLAEAHQLLIERERDLQRFKVGLALRTS